MSVRTDIKELMQDVQVNEDVKTKILNCTVRTRRRNNRRALMKKVVVVALAAVMCFGVVAVGANDIVALWDDAISIIFDADEKTQRKLISDGYVKVVQNESDNSEKMTATDNGITVTAKQILMDNRVVHVYFDVHFDEDKFDNALDGNFKMDIIKFDGKDYSTTFSWNYFINENGISKNRAGYMISLAVDDMSLDGKELEIKLKDFVGIEETYKGKWNFKFIVHGSNKGKAIKLNDEWMFTGKNQMANYKLQSIELYQMTICINYELSGNIGFAENIPVKIVMNDGTVYEDPDTEVDLNQESNSLNDITLARSMTINREVRELSRPLDIDAIDYVEICGKRYEVE